MSCPVTDPAQIQPWGVEDCSAGVAGAGFLLHRVIVYVGDVENLEAQLPTRKSLEERSSAVQRPTVCHNAVLGRAHGMPDLL